jgi:hypothetical protein
MLRSSDDLIEVKAGGPNRWAYWGPLRGTASMPDQFQSQRYPGDPLAMFELSRNMLLAQQKMMPSTRMFERFSEAARSVAQAHMAYCQALMRANAVLLSAMMERPNPWPAAQERPSVDAKKSDFTQP